MAPPLKPIARARSQFFGEPEPSQFFPPSPALKTMSPFGQYDSPALLGEQMMEREDILARRNKLATDLAGGAYQRQQFASQGRILPYSEQVAIASAQLAEKQALGNLEDLPQTQEAERVTRDYRMAQARQGMQEIPAQAEYEQKRRAAAMEQFGTEDPNIRKLQTFAKDPQTLLAYESLLDDPATANLPSSQRKRIAYLNALGMEQDRPAIEAVDFELQSNPNANAANRSKLIEPVIDPVTGAIIGERIKKDADRNQLSGLIAKSRNQKRIMEMEREKRQSESAAQKGEASEMSFQARIADRILSNPDMFDTLSTEDQDKIREIIKRAAGVGKEPEQKKAGALDRLQ